MADDIVEQLAWLRDEFCDVDSVTSIVDLAMTEIERLRAAGDALAAAVNDEHLPRFCEIGCQSREAVEVWEKIRRG